MVRKIWNNVKSHPHEGHFIEFAKKALTEDYLKSLADFIKRNYPGSAESVLPKLREIYTTKFGRNRGAQG